MDFSISQENSSALEHWLRRVGFSAGNPFGINEAEREIYVPEYFVDPGVYSTIKDDSCTALVFAPRGGGKTALRVMLSSDCRPLQPTTVNPRSQTLAITYTDFDPALAACNYDLSQLVPAHHMNQILSTACSTLLDALWQDIQLTKALSPPDRSLFAAYCHNYNPALLRQDAVFRRLKLTCPQNEFNWGALKQAVSERHLKAFFQKNKLPHLPQLDLYADLVDDQPESLAHTDSVITSLSGFTHLIQRIGLKSVCILIDRLDERLLTLRDPHKLAMLIAPLISHLPLMQVSGMAFKLFLPREAREAIMPFLRSDRLKMVEVEWNDEQLRELLHLRLQVYSEDKIQSLGKLCERPLASHIEDEMIEFADGSPRRLLQLGAALLKTHISLAPNSRAISNKAWAQTPAKAFGKKFVRLLHVDRQTAQVYLGMTTPIHLAPTPYRLLVYLYASKGFRTTEEIKTGVWPDERYISDDMVRQNVRRVRQALEEAGVDPTDYLVNEPGRGYKLQNTG